MRLKNIILHKCKKKKKNFPVTYLISQNRQQKKLPSRKHLRICTCILDALQDNLSVHPESKDDDTKL